MLIEAGYLEEAFTRFEEAKSIAPRSSTVHWETARAMALEERWDEHARYVSHDVQRPIAQSRFAWWRGDLARLREIRPTLTSVFVSELTTKLVDCFLDGNWAAVRDDVVARVVTSPSPNRRRNA